MDNQYQYISYVGVGVIVSVTLFVAFKAGQIFGPHTDLSFELDRIKHKTACLVKQIWDNALGNAPLPDGLDISDIVEKVFIFGAESVEEQIFGLDQIDFDLFWNGLDSVYFSLVLDECFAYMLNTFLTQ